MNFAIVLLFRSSLNFSCVFFTCNGLPSGMCMACSQLNSAEIQFQSFQGNASISAL